MSRDDTRPEVWEERLASLSPEKRRLLELRLEKEREARERRRAAERASSAPDPFGGLDTADLIAGPTRPLDFSLFFFSSDPQREGRGDAYRLLFDAARFADEHFGKGGFTAVWTPERHFVDFGGLYPNPSLLGAALAASTRRLEIRAGSVVLPLHHPIRVAEEWAVVDNLSGGRAAISCASGWHPSDFSLAQPAPIAGGGDGDGEEGAYGGDAAGLDTERDGEAVRAARRRLYDSRKDEMFRRLDEVRRLWRGGTARVTGGDGEEYEVAVRPRPVRGELPVWVTSAGSVETWRRAGEAGAHVLAAMGSQPPADLAKKVRLYRQARADAGHDPTAGKVSLMLHTYLADDLDEVKRVTREPLSEYLRSYVRQQDNLPGLAEGVSTEDREALIPLAFEHYVAHASLLGTPATAATMLHRLSTLGIDEVACLVDFGLPAERVLAGLEPLARVAREHAVRAAGAAAEDGGREAGTEESTPLAASAEAGR